MSHTLSEDTNAAEETLRRAGEAGLDLSAITGQLEREGVSSFCDSYRHLLDCIQSKLERIVPAKDLPARLA